MSRYREPICRLCRVEKSKLFLKGNKCLTEKCPLERRAYAPGQHGRGPETHPGLRDPAPGETEAETLLRDVRKTIPPVLRAGGAAERRHRRNAPGHARTAPGQRGLCRRLRPFPGPCPATHQPRPFPGQRRRGSRFRPSRSRPATWFPSGSVTAKTEDVKATVEAHKNKAVPGWIEVDWDGMSAADRVAPDAGGHHPARRGAHGRRVVF